MKLTRSIRTSNRGSVVIMALTVVAIAAIMLGSYLTLVQFQSSSVARSQAWNASITLTEAGIEEGMALVNKTYPAIITDQWAWTSGINSDGWTDWSNNSTTVTRYLATNGYGVSSYSVIITNVNNSPQVTAVGYAPYTSIPWAYDQKNTFLSLMSFSVRPFFAAAGASSAGSTVMVARKVQVQTAMDSLFMMGLVAKSNINMNGNNILVDSYDSSNTNYSTWYTNSTWGTNLVYSASKRRDKGDVATDSALANAVSVGNANIYGKLHTGPGSAATTATIGQNGSVGDLAWQTAGNTGFQPNAWLSDMNVNFPDVPAPTGSPLPPVSTVWTNGVTYNYTLSSSGVLYGQAAAISGKVLVLATNTILWAKGGLSFSGNSDGIYIAPGASVVIYVGTSTGSAVTANLTGQGGINANGYARNCQIYGLPTCTSISMSGNAAFVGTIYAPEATLGGSGGGNNDVDSMGAVIVKDVSLNGHWKFHYDESLRVNGPLRGWVVKNWQEVAAQ